MHKVLIVSPHFPPIDATDNHRTRMWLPYLQEFGWETSVLAVAPEFVEGVRDPFLNCTVPEEIRITRTWALPSRVTRQFGFANLGMRSLPHLHRAGTAILREQEIDLVFFSTTEFLVMALGPLWKKQFGIPYVLDFIDPWLNDYYDKTGVRPPGGPLRYGLSQTLARYLEPRTLQHADQVIAVSPAYPKMFLSRYDWLRESQFTTLPYGAPESDFDTLSVRAFQQRMFDPRDGKRHWVYVGAAGQIMSFALRALFLALRRGRESTPDRFSNLMLHFIGTDYAPTGRGRKTVEPIAVECGVGDLVREQPERIPYFEALKCIADAEALIVPGSDDPGYTASKIYPYILARKPLLAVFHEQSSVVDVLRQTKAGLCVTFRTGDDLSRVSAAIYDEWYKPGQLPAPETDWEAFRPYTAREMTRKACQVFDRCLNL